MYVYFLLNQLTVGQILIDTELIEKKLYFEYANQPKNNYKN